MYLGTCSWGQGPGARTKGAAQGPGAPWDQANGDLGLGRTQGPRAIGTRPIGTKGFSRG